MSDVLYSRLVEDRIVRDAAKTLVEADVAYVKADLKGQSIGSRISGRFTEGASEVLDEARDVAQDNKGILAALIGAIVLWFARNPIMALFTDNDDNERNVERFATSND